MDKSALTEWIRQLLFEQNVHDFDLDFGGTSAKTDGYLGDINFVTVTFQSNGSKKNLSLVIKNSKTNKTLRETFPLASFFEEEIYIYEKVFPAMKKFQIDKGIKNIFDSYPKCFKTVVGSNIEVIVLENLKSRGYELHDRTKPLNLNHLKIVLTEYAKLHALSFAMKDQLPEEFDKLIKNTVDTVQIQFSNNLFSEIMNKEFRNVLSILKNRNELDVYERYQETMKKDIINDVREILECSDPKCQVISHGDAWINNYMFLYQNDKSTPAKISFIDWQMSAVRCSPVFDLSHFLYCCATPEDLDNLEDLLAIYYESFSKFLTQLGSSPKTLFSFEDLKSHWNKFSFFGAVLAIYVLKQSFWDSKDAPDLEMLETESEDNLKNVISAIVIQDEDYYRRLIAVHRNLFFYKWNT